MLSHSCGPATKWRKKAAMYHQKLHKGLDFAMNVRALYLHHFNSAVRPNSLTYRHANRGNESMFVTLINIKTVSIKMITVV